MKKITFLFTVLILLNFTILAYGQILLEQGKVELNVSPDEVITGTLNINNTSKDEVNVRMYWQDFIYQPPYEGSKKFVPAGTTDLTCSSWISFSPKEMKLPPHGRGEILYSINVPGEIKGGYYGVLFIEKGAVEVQGFKGLSVITRVGCLFFIESEDKIKKAHLDNISISGDQVTGEFINEGDVVLVAHPVYYIINNEGIAVDRGEFSEIYLPPSKSTEVKLKYNKEIDPGKYTMVVSIDLQGGDILVKEIDFEKESSSNINISEIRD